MKKLILIVLLFSTVYTSFAQAPPCNATLIGTNTTVVSSTMLMDSAASSAAHNNILVCSGNTLTYNWVLGKDFYVMNGATLILKCAQIAKISLETGATLVFDTAGAVFNNTIISGLTYDASSVTMTDTNQIHIPSAAIYWNSCVGNTFNYTAFTPVQPCTPLSVDNSLKTVLEVTFANPVSQSIALQAIVKEQLASATIIDVSGKVIRSVSDLNSPIDVSFLPQGIYFLQLKSKEGVSLVKKFYKN